MKELYFTSPYRRSTRIIRLEYGQVKKVFILRTFEGEINGRGTSESPPKEEVFEDEQELLKKVYETKSGLLEGRWIVLSWFTRNTKNWHIVYNWLPYSKPIERDALCPDVHVADFQTFKKLKQSCLMSRMEFHYHRYVRTWEYIQINTTTGKNRPFPVCLMYSPETLFGRSAVINAKLIT